jgi:hypothetical protein
VAAASCACAASRSAHACWRASLTSCIASFSAAMLRSCICCAPARTSKRGRLLLGMSIALTQHCTLQSAEPKTGMAQTSAFMCPSVRTCTLAHRRCVTGAPAACVSVARRRCSASKAACCAERCPSSACRSLSSTWVLHIHRQGVSCTVATAGWCACCNGHAAGVPALALLARLPGQQHTVAVSLIWSRGVPLFSKGVPLLLHLACASLRAIQLQFLPSVQSLQRAQLLLCRCQSCRGLIQLHEPMDRLVSTSKQMMRPVHGRNALTNAFVHSLMH